MQIAQIGMNSSDIAGSLRLYAEAFGFRNAGAQALWGDAIGIQGLPPSARTLLWWMVGAQPFFQLELFHHSNPPQRPLRPDWRPCDHGWVRIGVAVQDMAACRTALAANTVPLLGETDGSEGGRMAFRDPYIGIIVEVMEMRKLRSPEGPTIVYAASSVADIDGALVYYRDALGLPIRPLGDLHEPEDEALWGLSGARREGFLVDAGNVLLEIVAYSDPSGRPRPDDYRNSDQGIVNVALGSRDKQEAADLVARLARHGHVPVKLMEKGDILSAYFTAHGREIEVLSIPSSYDRLFGFVPAQDFFR